MGLKLKIQKVDAFQVNLLDTTGEQLMTEKQVQTVIDNALGEIIDGWKLPFVGAREKLTLHKCLLESLGGLAEISNVVNAFNDAKDDL